ncbi:hypothetical protein ACFPMF_15510 [Larkinella bovis]|uniref:Transposase n=1 Tax=Larkinella bovis TaxID=683041 RepID=A0ABW0IB43_9BACT
MPRRSIHPIIFEDQLKFSLSDFKRYGWMSGVPQPRTLTWSRFGKVYASINVTILLDGDDTGGCLNLEYHYDGQVRSQVVDLEPVKSNLGKGIFWYMICPVTGDRCRDLLDGGGRFVSRKALIGALYQRQAMSKNTRSLNAFLDATAKYKLALDSYFKPHRKKYYREKPTLHTRRFLKLKSQMECVHNLPDLIRSGLS